MNVSGALGLLRIQLGENAPLARYGPDFVRGVAIKKKVCFLCMVFSLGISYLMRNLGRGLQKVVFSMFLLLSLVFRVIRFGFGAF